ncbi:MAG TPA: hypothetical protein VEA69_10480 [Tepidisphaeraceae bacterium]|nr:hypothetical protein [Tepidisphaeraceae bacterium]
MSPKQLSAVAEIATWSGEAHALLVEIAPAADGPVATAIARAARILDVADELLTRAYLADARTVEDRETVPRWRG